MAGHTWVLAYLFPYWVTRWAHKICTRVFLSAFDKNLHLSIRFTSLSPCGSLSRICLTSYKDRWRKGNFYKFTWPAVFRLVAWQLLWPRVNIPWLLIITPYHFNQNHLEIDFFFKHKSICLWTIKQFFLVIGCHDLYV